ncbi:DNA-binding transcriptional regulator, AcrR family [Raineyella antarctica]|uniref:DNA-binding transcriptional regulator, AcrR family n=1 Tax=Raineyella antarctica TaxID=1577474 RepID=A0A1G6H2P2_9ACTN|nr:TetR family transcriptional regulator [Raineyella antarctica]SDB88549.1 DNA-binding transcriptional regulator, AcrR family [Raineyella antarctica]
MARIELDPESPGLRERKKRLTARRIHQVALTTALARGASNVTVKEICDGADISSRTFFNYYASKSAAILGAGDLEITEEQKKRFLQGTGSVLEDLCTLVADLAGRSELAHEDRTKIKQALAEDPELVYEMSSLMRSLRCALRDLVTQRTGAREGAMVVSLVFAALPFAYTDEEQALPLRLREAVAELAAVAAAGLGTPANGRP